MSRREQIKMDAAEVAAFLREERTVVCATLGPHGWPHLMPLWYVLREPGPREAGPRAPGPGDARPPEAGLREAGLREAGTRGPELPEAELPEAGPQLWSWTYAASQKVRNLGRDARATLQVQAGEAYHELRGVMLECEVVVHRDLDTVSALGREILARNAVARGEPAVELPAEAAAVVVQQAAKRVGLQFVERRRTSWDHRKLGGIY